MKARWVLSAALLALCGCTVDKLTGMGVVPPETHAASISRGGAFRRPVESCSLVTGKPMAAAVVPS